jgi:ABC-type transport system involved in cytochrome c biogenesis permease subunit
MDVHMKVNIFYSIWNSYNPIDKLFEKADSPERLERAIAALEPFAKSVESKNPPAAIPPREVPEKLDPKLPPPRWHAYVPAFFDMVTNFDAKKIDNPTTAFRQLTNLIREGGGKSKEINQAVVSYEKMLSDRYGALARLPKTRFEAWYEHFDPIGLSYILYVLTGLTALLGFAVAREHFRQAAFWICVLTLTIHTIAIASRIYISERPPVVSLYSAAVFIGWAVVLACVVAELLFPISISLVIASIVGFLSLQVAYGLDIGDSMPVLQAVLDTQFWLSTHVISVTLGYAATFLAGFLGIFIIGVLFVQRWLRSETQRLSVNFLVDILYRICYGIVCFGIFFSFVGTVLGGLWGDDSWGRFWGWDPKENGALMIVLWNALLLHARWDKLVGPLGFAMLAVVGNIVTAWSFFGTNILGIGLHAYGGEPGDSIRNMAMFVGSQLAIILFGGITYALMRSEQNTIENKTRTA